VEGSSLVLRGSADGEPPFSYQWLGETAGLNDTQIADPTFVAVDDAEVPVALFASDALGFSASDATSITILNAAPTVGPISGPSAPVQLGSTIEVTAPFSDPGAADSHTGAIDWDDGTIGPATIDSGLRTASGMHTYLQPGVYSIALTVFDDDGGSMTQVFRFAVVYDPAGGFVTGGGWIDSPAGAYRANPSSSGMADFGFVSKYPKGASVPKGATHFEFQAGLLSFRSDVQEWLVVNQGGTNAQFKGVGTVNGAGTFTFMIWAGDEAPDTFRIKIWRDTPSGEAVVYDNGQGQAVGGGSVQIHKSG
jgi:hypothetical protein